VKGKGWKSNRECGFRDKMREIEENIQNEEEGDKLKTDADRQPPVIELVLPDVREVKVQGRALSNKHPALFMPRYTEPFACIII
jgi:hypothetical protein